MPENKKANKSGEPDSELVAQFLDNQSKELALKVKDIEFQTQHDNNSLEFAKASLTQ